MIRNRILSLLVCAALLACLLAGCSTSSGTDGGEAASSSSSAASSESIPSSTTQANTGKLTPNLDESDNSIFSPASTQDAFAPCLGWGPGVSGCSLKSVIAADSLLSWAENGNLAMQTTDVIEDAYTEWYDSLSTDEQDSFADAWPLIKEDANALLTDTSSMTGRIEDAGLNAKELEKSVALMRHAAEKGVGIVLIEHKMDMIMNVCDHIVVLNFGKMIAHGTPEEVQSNEAVIEAYLGR